MERWCDTCERMVEVSLEMSGVSQADGFCSMCDDFLGQYLNVMHVDEHDHDLHRMADDGGPAHD